MADDKNSTGKETIFTPGGWPLPSLDDPTLTPEQAEALAKLLKEQADRQAALEAWERLWDAVRANLEPALEHFCRMCEAVAEAITPVLQELGRQLAPYADLLCEDDRAYTWAKENRPKWAHMAKHGRSARIRKKYMYRILREYRKDNTNGRE